MTSRKEILDTSMTIRFVEADKSPDNLGDTKARREECHPPPSSNQPHHSLFIYRLYRNRARNQAHPALSLLYSQRFLAEA